MYLVFFETLSTIHILQSHFYLFRYIFLKDELIVYLFPILRKYKFGRQMR